MKALPRIEPRTWQESSAADRERLTQLEREQERMRESLHEFRSDVQSVRYLAEKIAGLATDVRELATKVEAVSRHAVQRPSQTSLQVFGQYVGLIVAVVALFIATRG